MVRKRDLDREAVSQMRPHFSSGQTMMDPSDIIDHLMRKFDVDILTATGAVNRSSDTLKKEIPGYHW